MTPDEITELVKDLREVAKDAEGRSYVLIEGLCEEAVDAIECLQASVANAEARYDACEARNEFLTGVIEAIEQAAKEAKELPK